MLNSFLDSDDYNYGYSPFHYSPYERQRAMEVQRQRAIEIERRRRAAAAAAAAEEERRRRIAHQQARLERQRQAEEYERARLAEEERRRHQMLQRQLAQEEERRRAIRGRKPAIVRASDGRLYRVFLEDNDDDASNYSTQPRTKKQSSLSRKQNKASNKSAKLVSFDDPMDTEPVATSATNEADYESAVEGTDESTVRVANRSSTVTPTRTPSGRKSKKGKKKITITVEDASDSEYDDDLKSPWRNRRPASGQWMEPVEDFDTKMKM